MGRIAGSRALRRALAAWVVLVSVAGLGVVGLHGRDRAEAFTAADAVAAHRAATATSTSDGATGAGATVDDAPADVAAGTAPTTAASAEGAPTTTSSTVAPVQPAAGTETAPAAAPTDAPSAAAPTPLAPPGVYVYDTEGYEHLDALGGARHDYPAETTISIRHEGCGATETWQPLEDRRDVRSVCAEPGRHRLQWYDSSRAFFGQSDSRRLDCDAQAVAFVAGARAGDTFAFACTDPETDARNVVEVLGTEAVDVGGVTVEAVRVRATSDVTGDSRARSVIDSWVHPEHGLTLRRISVLDGTSQGPGGEVSYHEEYTLRLRSLDPLR